MPDLLADAITPPPLAAGQRVGVCAPSGPCPAARLRAGLDALAGRVDVVLGPVARRLLDGGAPPGFLAGSDDERADELHGLLHDPDVRAIVMARGGHGLTRLLPRLDGALLRADPRPIVGFSDGTALLAWALHAGVRPLHGPVLVQLPDLPAADVDAFVDALAGRFPSPLATGLSADAPLAGRLVGGNLTVLAQLVGTPWAMPLAGGLLVLEEVGERPYELDRDLTQLRNAGALRDVAGVLVGDLTRCVDPPGGPDDPTAARAVLAANLADLGVAFGLPVGHGARNRTWPVGARARLDVARGTLLHEP